MNQNITRCEIDIRRILPICLSLISLNIEIINLQDETKSFIKSEYTFSKMYFTTTFLRYFKQQS